jgi:hypothetical protein
LDMQVTHTQIQFYDTQFKWSILMLKVSILAATN